MVPRLKNRIFFFGYEFFPFSDDPSGAGVINEEKKKMAELLRLKIYIYLFILRRSRFFNPTELRVLALLDAIGLNN